MTGSLAMSAPSDFAIWTTEWHCTCNGWTCCLLPNARVVRHSVSWTKNALPTLGYKISCLIALARLYPLIWNTAVLLKDSNEKDDITYPRTKPHSYLCHVCVYMGFDSSAYKKLLSAGGFVNVLSLSNNIRCSVFHIWIDTHTHDVPVIDTKILFKVVGKF